MYNFERKEKTTNFFLQNKVPEKMATIIWQIKELHQFIKMALNA